MFNFVIGIHAERTAYKGPTYIGPDEFGKGLNTFAEVESFLEQYAERTMASLSPAIRAAGIYTGRFVARVRKPCRECDITGVKRGCKRKKCPACAGEGSTPVVDFVARAR